MVAFRSYGITEVAPVNNVYNVPIIDVSPYPVTGSVWYAVQGSRSETTFAISDSHPWGPFRTFPAKIWFVQHVLQAFHITTLPRQIE